MPCERKIWLIVLSLMTMLSSCSVTSLHEAQEGVAQADSLWHEGKMYGVDEGDSATLAQAYERLKELSAVSRQLSDVSYQLSEVCPFVHRTSLLCTYAHACYHYGKLLRAKDNPVEAMRVFIDATHSGTKDYHILGRVYSNMGDICHLANEFPLSYDMFERSAEMFLRNGDTLLHYYLLNDMAFELAEQGKKKETETLIDSITLHCTNQGVKVKTLETKALLYQSLKCHDSVITTIDSLQSIGYNDVIELTMKARAFHNLNWPDSALYYANKVVQHSPTDACAIAAYYILSHSKDTINKDSVLILTSARADAQRAWAYSQSKLAQAVQLLEQDLNRKPDFRWLYAILATLLIIGTSTGIYAYRKYNKRELLSQQVNDLLNKNDAEIQRHEQIVQAHSDYKKIRMSEIENNCATITAAENFPKNIHWSNFEDMCKIMDDNFYMLASRLHQRHVLNETEIRLCILVLLNLSRTEISNILPYALSGVGKLKDQTAKELGTTGKNLREYLLKMTIEEC